MDTLLKIGTLFGLALLTNGPWSPVVPTGTEPLVMLYGRMLPPLLVAAIATAGAVLMELVNWRLYGAALASRRLARVRGSKVADVLVRRFARAPFLATLACAVIPVPFWLARCCAILESYPRRRFFAALAIGRLGSWWLCAAVGGKLPRSFGGMLAVVLLLAGFWALGARTGSAALPEA